MFEIGRIFAFLLISEASLLAPSAFSAANSPRAPNQYALSLYHWNIQYVSGSKATEDEIVRQAFAPVLELYSRHPDWKATFELQGYMIEVIAERFPEVLEMIQRMNRSGQLELVSFHYSDQLVLGFPRADEEKSLEINDKIFADYGLTLSPVVFVQEDQMSEGIADLMRKRGQNIAVVMGGWDDFHSDPPAPYYNWGGINLIKIQQWNQNGPVWVFTGDAEQAGTNVNSTPYFTYIGWGMQNFFQKSDSALEKLEQTMLRLEKDHAIASIEDYVRAMKESRVAPTPTGKILDKVRQLGMNGVWLWLGDNSLPVPGGEDDVRVRSYNFESRNELLGAETYVKNAGARGLDVYAEKSWLKAAWRLQLMAEVSDASGMSTPFPIEVQTSLDQSRSVIEVSKSVVHSLKLKDGKSRVRIDTKAGSIEELPGSSKAPKKDFDQTEGPIKIEISGRINYEVQWRKVQDNTWEAHFTFWPTLPGWVYRYTTAEIRFPRMTSDVIYSPALLEDRVTHDPLSSFAFKHMYLPLTNGLVGLGDDYYVIKHNTQNHVAVKIDKESNWISFATRNPPMTSEGHRWVFTVFKGSERDALELANRINVTPILDR